MYPLWSSVLATPNRFLTQQDIDYIDIFPIKTCDENPWVGIILPDPRESTSGQFPGTPLETNVDFKNDAFQ